MVRAGIILPDGTEIEIRGVREARIELQKPRSNILLMGNSNVELYLENPTALYSLTAALWNAMIRQNAADFATAMEVMEKLVSGEYEVPS